jgi:hypothetical protein
MQSGGIETIDTAMTAAPRSDGRNRRAERSRAKALGACRAAMAAGDFRPSIVSVARIAGMSVRTVFGIFGSIEALHREALADQATRDQIVTLIVRQGGLALAPADQMRIVLAATTGKA